ncbi:enolase C-terminal domain-like protein [Aquibium oceanicum]|uniref:Mandelate racemase n=1 Tax=Aquibium oceanicum TaxID=1670800 RepID=A0A1L3ST77_9HYPH|nr:enolase C-terminal domain-like protein [Aquibium oceanicum]APH72525.1 mandelate racemase [Aquibium oceanicum]
MKVRLLEIERRERPYRLRMPFRFGVTTATHGRQAIVRARVALEDGREAFGWSAEALGAKWFDKNLALSDDDNHHQLRRALELASDARLAAGADTPFGHFAAGYGPHIAACAAQDLNPLIASYGQSLVDRALLDGFCRALGISFYEALRTNAVGLRAASTAPDLGDADLSGLFDDFVPAGSISVRHTVGLVDPILASDLAPEARVNDGLPETLEEIVAFYGNRHFKLKIGGDAEADIDRLTRIASVLDRIAEPYAVTLDGNEQYADAEAIADFWERIAEMPALSRLVSSTLYVEQPIARARALSTSVEALARRIPVIIDESDGELSAFVEARRLGYSGVSSKACKGIWKSILNHARCRAWNAGGERRFFMSAEDLTCEPGISLQQDLALVNLLGLTHVERNAHHFIDGFGGGRDAEAERFLDAHPDLYHRQDGRIRSRVDGGAFSIASLDTAGFGANLDPDFDRAETMPQSAWGGKNSV